MIRYPPLGDAATRAIAHVSGKSAGGPLVPGSRVTVHFHPDRAYGGEPMLGAMADRAARDTVDDPRDAFAVEVIGVRAENPPAAGRR